MATFILVHGTWARDTHWPALRDGLVLAASAVGEHSRFEELRWSGKNRASARERAGVEIFSLVQKIQSTSRNEKIFIIGHSHGGSVIAYFLKEYSSLAKTLSGCAFLSTPFVAIRPKVRATVYAVWFVLGYAFTAVYPYTYLRLFGGDYLHSPLLYLSEFCLLVPFLIFYWKSPSPEKSLEEAHRRQTADIPPGNYLFVRCSGDEAAALLSAAQCIAWLSMKVSQLLQLVLRPALSGTWKSVAYFALLGSTLTWWTSFVSPGDRDAAIRDMGIPYLLVLALWIAYCSLIACSVAAFLIFLSQALTSRAFGWTELSVGFFVELAIEPLPFGPHSMVHIDWGADPLRLEGITHSWTYAHPAAIRCIQDWVKTALHRDGNS